MISNVIKRLINNYRDRITITFFGAKPAIVDECGLRYLSYVNNYSDYMTVMSSQGFDIGLAPMIPTEFSSCKHYNKYIEYASYGIVGIYSDVLPYTRAVRDRENGMLCDNDADAWYEAIAELIDDPDLLNRMRDQCLEEARTKYSVETVSEQYYGSLCRCAQDQAGEIDRSFDLWVFGFKIRQFISRCWNFALRHLKKVLKKRRPTE